MQLQLGWKAGTEQYPPEQLLEYAIVAEKAGFDSIDVSDHFHPWSERGQACFVWTWLGAAAAKTSRIILGTGVTCPILRYHPAIVAQAACYTGVFGAAARVSWHRHRRGSQRVFGDGIVACLQNQTGANDRSDRIDPCLVVRRSRDPSWRLL